MHKNISVIKTKACCGCGACYNKCPVGAITMQENEEGFLVPVIDKNKCTNCGLCVKVCPSLNVQYNNTDKPECYAAMADDEIRMKSSSGGIFTLLAEDILDKGGYVCGAAFDDNWDVHHIIVDNKNDLEKLRGSKYVQSDTEDCYKKIKKLLDEDKYVLFSGCPCQVAGLYSFLGKNYEKLYTMDLICHGSPSRKVWRRYLQENFDVDDIKEVNFRDKSIFGWSTTMNIYFKNNKAYHSPHNVDPFYRGFVPCMILNKHCGICKYTKLPRQGDISLGDWWGIDKFKKGLNDGKGTSQVLINSAKGKMLYKKISSLLKINDDIGLDTTLKSINKTIYQPFRPNPHRLRFFKDLEKFPISKNIIDSIENKYDVCLITTFAAENYGAMLVAFAVNKILENLGYSVLMMQRPNPKGKDARLENSVPMNFAKKHYNISNVYFSLNDLSVLNNHCENFVVGSDQLFSYILNMERAFLDFVDINKNKIAFATSFGRDEYLTNDDIILKRKAQLHRFNHISLREKGEKLCNEIFDIPDAVELLDPTQMIELDVYNELCKNVSLKETQKPYLLTYDLDITPEKTEAIKYVANKLGLEIVYIQPCFPRDRHYTDLKVYKDTYTPEEFLYLYKNASFVISDSYHGTLFAVKFNKPFISIMNVARGALRYKFFERLNLKHRIVGSPEEIYNNDELLKSVDFMQANKVIEQESVFAIDWLKNALEDNNSKEKFSAFENYMELKIKELEKKVSALPAEDASYKQQFLLLGNKYDILKKYYRYKLFAKILRGKKQEHYILKSKIYHEKVRIIRKLEKELEL